MKTKQEVSNLEKAWDIVISSEKRVRGLSEEAKKQQNVVEDLYFELGKLGLTQETRAKKEDLEAEAKILSRIEKEEAIHRSKLITLNGAQRSFGFLSRQFDDLQKKNDDTKMKKFMETFGHLYEEEEDSD